MQAGAHGSTLWNFYLYFMGDPRRWRTMPWMVSIFGFFVVPLGAVSILFVIFQPVIVGAWCTICLITAVLMVLMIALSLDEILAMIGYMRQARRAGKPLWHTFWRGGDAFGDNLTPQRYSGTTRPYKEMSWGLSVPWNLVAVAVLGAWLMAAPAVFQVQGSAADINYIIGPLMWVFAIIALAEVARAARFVNILLAIGLMILLWLISDSSGSVTIAYGLNNLVIGALIIALSVRPGKIKDMYGSWNRLII